MNSNLNKPLPVLHECTVAIIGLGYVGLPLAIEFAKNKSTSKNKATISRQIIGFDINDTRLNQLNSGIDVTGELSDDEKKLTSSILLTSDPSQLTTADVLIVTVPTPIDDAKRPDLRLLKNACRTVGIALKNRKKNFQTLPLVIFESTVYPGTTEEICVPIIENHSQLSYNIGFACGYSPERINPGDKTHRITNIVKVTSGSTDEVSIWVDSLYNSIIDAGTHMAKSIKIAEAAKVIENTQRDLNIALVNELSMIFRRLQIDTQDVLNAASSKWNFLNFTPGLVGGHCIGVDPYYLTYKAEQVGYYPQVVLAGRRINDNMAKWYVQELILELTKRNIIAGEAKILILGFTFKENCPDIRNTRIIDLKKYLDEYGIQTNIVDPYVDSEQVKEIYDIDVSNKLSFDDRYIAVIAAVAHKEFIQLSPEQWNRLLCENGILFDIKGIIPRKLNPLRI
ncbi:nucleotide sugar dehydrogenase [bacterium]|nr:nucleotide sugar dehydrogenase [bacterium]